MKNKYWDAEVVSSKILKSKIDGESLIVDSFIQHSEILHGEIFKSRVMKSQVSGAKIYNAEIYNSTVIGRDVKILGYEGQRPIFQRCLLTDHSFVSGNTHLEGIVMARLMRIERGRWNRQPRYFEVETIDGNMFGVTESIGFDVFFGCRNYMMQDLIRHKRIFQIAMKFSDETIDMIESKFVEWMDNPMPTFQRTTVGAI